MILKNNNSSMIGLLAFYIYPKFAKNMILLFKTL